MRKIDKSIALSTEYKSWADGLGEEHPPYNSSKHHYYTDIVMNLLHCQHGLCAYTEQQLCPSEYLTVEHWQNGRYVDQNTEKSYAGQLEHFDERLKHKENDPDTKKQDWLWSNLFVVDSDTNNRKGSKPIDYILKPDTDDYNPFDFLEYSDETHHYIPNPKIRDEDPDKWQRIDKMIDILGLNFPNLVDKRKVKIPMALELGIRVIEPEFPTAFQFVSRKQNP